MAETIPHPPSAIRNPKSTDETIKETIESIVIAFILAFVFRAYVVEAFVIPTGSMAPTLLGQHTKARCPQCGYRFAVDMSGHDFTDAQNPPPLLCPMCRFEFETPVGVATQAGDRLLVQKYIYQLTEPKRWDVVVFRNPQARNDDGSPGPDTNYIKRLVGLPGEDLYILDGNIHTKPLGAPDTAWKIARKTDPAANPHWEAIQRALWQPIYHSRFVPLDHGRATPQSTRGGDWRPPWTPVTPTAGQWAMGSPATGWRGSYTFTHAAGTGDNPHRSPGSGTLAFDWADYYPRGVQHPYNQPSYTGGIVNGQPIEDIRLAATVEPTDPLAAIELSTTALLDGESAQRITARFTMDALTILRGPGDPADTVTLETIRLPGLLAAGRRTPLELWVVDQEVLVFADGQVLWRKFFDLPLDRLKERGSQPDHPQVSIRVDTQMPGSTVTLHDVQLDRDIYYTPNLSNSPLFARFGVLRRDAQGRVIEARPMRIFPDRFFVLGDNSPISNDARFWETVDPWVERQMFLESARAPDTPLLPGGDAALIRDFTHLVPRSLMIGRAFFIYYPAPFAVLPGGNQVLPNFADMRRVR